MASSQPKLSVAEALERLLARFPPLPAESVPLSEAAGRILAVDVTADLDLPPFANSAMDGFAVRARDVASAASDSPVNLRVVGESFAGAGSLPDVGPGEAVRIMTGAPVPPTADAVVPVEQTSSPGAMAGLELPDQVEILGSARPGDNVRPAGQDVAAGQVVLKAGRRLQPSDVGMLAALGFGAPRVHRKPRVAILSTGDELVEIESQLGPGQIRDSNSYSLLASVAQAGGLPTRLGIAPDGEAEVEARLDAALESGADLILSSGGVSMGAYDFVRVVVEKVGRLEFWKVNIRPGKPLAFGEYRGIPLIGLPGNPVSALVTFEVFVRPALDRLSGLADTQRRRIQVVLQDTVKSDGRESYLRSVVSWTGGRYLARLTRSQDSSVLSSLLEANALLVVPAGLGQMEVGEEAEAWLLGDLVQA